jgi:hypothetical protein
VAAVAGMRCVGVEETVRVIVEHDFPGKRLVDVSGEVPA